jgi:probable F420-dependent oxidoreductase
VTHARRLRFGVQLRSASSAADWVERIRRVEDAGYSVVSMPDHFAGQIAPLPALTAAAFTSSRLRLGTWVLSNDFRHPAVLAKEAATLDLLSDGRLELGLGAGWMLEDYARAGIGRDAARVRIERLAETIAVLRGLWSSGAFSFRGAHYRIDALDGEPSPVQQPLPIQIGGGGRAVLSLAAREAQIVGLAMRLTRGQMDAEAARSLTAKATDEKLGWIREAAGNRFASLELNARVLWVAAGADAAARVQDQIDRLGIASSELAASPHALIGEPSHVCEQLLAARERWGVSYFTVSEDVAAALVPVVARLAGT